MPRIAFPRVAGLTVLIVTLAVACTPTGYGGGMGGGGIGGGGRGMGGSRGGGRRGGVGGAQGGGGQAPNTSAVDGSAAVLVPPYVNGVDVVLSHQAELVLTDSQSIRINAIKRALDSTTAPMLQRADSVRRQFARPATSTAQRDSLSRARETVLDIMTSVRDSVHAARDRAFALLTPTQLTKALELQDAAQRELDDRQRGSGRGGPPGQSARARSAKLAPARSYS